MCVCTGGFVLPGSALTQVSRERGSERSSKLRATFSLLHNPGIHGREGPCLFSWPWRAAVCVMGAGKLPPEAALTAPGETKGLRAAFPLLCWLPMMPKSSSHLAVDEEA